MQLNDGLEEIEIAKPSEKCYWRPVKTAFKCKYLYFVSTQKSIYKGREEDLPIISLSMDHVLHGLLKLKDARFCPLFRTKKVENVLFCSFLWLCHYRD